MSQNEATSPSPLNRAQRLSNVGTRAYWRRKYPLALCALTEAAAAGEPTAYYNLGILYSDGLAVAPDTVMACSCYRNAAERGHTAAAFNLGQAYRKGTGVSQDYAE